MNVGNEIQFMILCNLRTSCLRFRVLSDPGTTSAAAVLSYRSSDDLPRLTSAALIVRNIYIYFYVWAVGAGI